MVSQHKKTGLEDAMELLDHSLAELEETLRLEKAALEGNGTRSVFFVRSKVREEFTHCPVEPGYEVVIVFGTRHKAERYISNVSETNKKIYEYEVVEARIW
jgi:hypothetical protein